MGVVLGGTLRSLEEHLHGVCDQYTIRKIPALTYNVL